MGRTYGFKLEQALQEFMRTWTGFECQQRHQPESFESLDKELSAISNKIAVLDTQIGANTTPSRMFWVWEAVEDLTGDGRLLEGKFAAVEKRQMEVKKATKGISN
jgi:hypothetical protein